MAVYVMLLRAAARIAPRKRAVAADGLDVLLTGTFHSDNWIRWHLKPLADSARCRRVRIVATNSVPDVKNVEAIYPPRWMVRTIGALPARLLTFVCVAVYARPHVVGGFHLLINGLLTALVGRAIGARTLYFCVGGPVEALDGGVWGENRYFERVETPDAVIERRLLEAVAACDLVVTMGTRAVKFFQGRGIDTTFRVVPGGITPPPPASPVSPEFDFVLVARLVPIKRIDLFIRSLRIVHDRYPAMRALIVGDGPLRESLESLTTELGLTSVVTFAGQQPDVWPWLRRSRVFVLTSDSEGLALSLMEASLVGLPAVVSRVGDLPDLVEHGVSGYLVEGRTPEAFAERFMDLLDDDERYRRFSRAAAAAGAGVEMPRTVERWNEALDFDGRAALSPADRHREPGSQA
jgi:glycosyltransferase involved in cell wall biosynthesis